MNRPDEKPENDAMLEREIAEDEAWLGAYPNEEPSPLAVARVKQAVRAELTASTAKPKRHWGAWIGVAAAAAIVLAVVTSWPSATQDGTQVAEADANAGAEEVLEPWSSDETTQLNEMSEAVAELETWATNTAGDWDVASVYTAVEIASDETWNEDTIGDDVSLWLRQVDPRGEIVRNYDA